MRRSITAVICLTVLCLMMPRTVWCDDEGKAPKRILVLFSYNYNFPSQQHMVAGIELGRKTAGLKAGDFVYEYLDLSPKSLDQRRFFRDLLQKKYEGQTFDLIITIYDPALEFLLDEGRDFLPETPCLSIFAKGKPGLMRAGHEVLQIPLYYDLRGTLELSLKLFPKTRNVVFVVGTDPNDRVFEDQARRDFAPWRKKITVDYTVNLSVPDMVRAVSRLKPGTLVVYSRVTADAAGRRYVPGDVGAMLAESSAVPVFCLVSSQIDRGMMGGSLIDFESLGTLLSRTMVALTEGKPLSLESASAYIKPMFDWNQIRRFNAETDFLPPDTVYINRPKTLWSQYKMVVIGAMLVVFALASMVVALTIQNRNTILAAEIEERRQVQAVVQAANAYNRGLIETSLDPLVTIGPDGTITDVNLATELATGCGREELIGRDFADFFTEPEKARAGYRQVFKEGDVRDYPLYLRRKDGSSIPVLYNAAVYRGHDGQVVGVFAAARDITERKKAEEELREVNAYNRSLIDGTIDPLATVSPDGKILDVNPASEKATGYHRDELIGRDFADFFTEPERARAGYQQVFKEGHVQDYALYFRRRDGSTMPVLYNASVYRDRNGDVAGVLAAARDITRLKQAEEAQLSLERKLLQARKSESLGRMAGAIAHLYNNLLAVVIGNLELFVNDIPQEKPVDHSLAEAMKAARRAADVSGLMLTYLGQSFGQHEPLDLADVCRQNCDSLKAALPGGISLELELPPSGIAVRANAHQIQQVIGNLVTNAWEAIGDKGGVVRLSVRTILPSGITETRRSPLDWQPQARPHVCLEVADTGCGMAADVLDKVFDPFYTSKFTGRGLGLSVVSGVVKSHGGVVTVESEPDRGSVFRVYLPVSDDYVALKPETRVRAPEFREGGTVLLVEDDPSVRKMGKAMLIRLGFSVLEAKDGIEALEIYRQNKAAIRLVLSDLTMPRMDGWATLEALRKLDPGVPVILASGYDQAQVMAGDHPDRPQAFLGKPYQLASLGEAIRKALG